VSAAEPRASSVERRVPVGQWTRPAPRRHCAINHRPDGRPLSVEGRQRRAAIARRPKANDGKQTSGKRRAASPAALHTTATTLLVTLRSVRTVAELPKGDAD